MQSTREMLRHTLATLAYRGAKAVRGGSEDIAHFKASPTTRTPVQILAHIGDLLDWGLSMCRGKPAFHESAPLPWDREVERFHAALGAWDEYLASDARLEAPMDRVFQGPIADALTHVGQINLLRRMAGSPVRGESYNRATIEIGRTGADQVPASPQFEFD